GLGGGTVFSFLDLEGDAKASTRSLAETAVVSARFPAVLPPFTVADKKRRLNFVYGGYKDSSGASTALDIITAIKTSSPKEVDVRLVLPTSAHSRLAPVIINGSSLPDLLGPIITMLKVRDRLAEDSVIRATGTLDPTRSWRDPSPAQKGHDDWHV